MRQSVMVDLEREGSCVEDELFGMSDQVDLRSAMLRHEKVFRGQVLELHRLYWTQMNLMNKVDLDGLSGSFHPPPGKPMQDMGSLLHRSPLERENMDDRDLQRVFDIQCSSVYPPRYGFSSNETGFELKELDSSFGISKGVGCRNRSDLENYSCEQGSLRHQEVINLEGPPEMEMKNERTFIPVFGTKTPIPCREMKYGSVGQGPSGNGSCQKSENCHDYPDSGHLACQGQEIGSTKSDSLFTTQQQWSKRMEASFDLNVAQPEDLPVALESTDIDFTSSGSSFACAHVFEEIDHASNVKEIHSKIELNDSLLGVLGRSSSGQTFMIGGISSSHDCNSMALNETMNSSPKGSVELNLLVTGEQSTEFAEGMLPSLYGSSLTSSNSYLRAVNADTNNENLVSGSGSKRSEWNGLSLFGTRISQSLRVGGLEGKQLERENSDEDTLSSKIHGGFEGHLKVSNLSRNPPVLPEQFSEGVGSKSGVDLNSCSMGCQDVRDGFFLRTGEIANLETTGSFSALEKPNSQTHGIISLKGQYCNALQNSELTQKKQQAEESDGAVLTAAQCLTSMSLKKLKVKELMAVETNDQPQCSSDSLELIVLSLPDTQEEECSVPVRPRTEELRKGAARFSSRRGRKLRDFQKDVLPGLVSLSRHEICEDMHAFTEIARLSEINTKEKACSIYRRNWPTMTRKRRSRCH